MGCRRSNPLKLFDRLPPRKWPAAISFHGMFDKNKNLYHWWLLRAIDSTWCCLLFCNSFCSAKLDVLSVYDIEITCLKKGTHTVVPHHTAVIFEQINLFIMLNDFEYLYTYPIQRPPQRRAEHHTQHSSQDSGMGMIFGKCVPLSNLTINNSI